MQVGRKRAETRGKLGAKGAEPGTDWARVKREAKAQAPIPFEPGDGPYDPNDTAAVDAHWDQAAIRRGPGRPPLSVKRIVPVVPPETVPIAVVVLSRKTR